MVFGVPQLQIDAASPSSPNHPCRYCPTGSVHPPVDRLLARMPAGHRLRSRPPPVTVPRTELGPVHHDSTPSLNIGHWSFPASGTPSLRFRPKAQGIHPIAVAPHTPATAYLAGSPHVLSIGFPPSSRTHLKHIPFLRLTALLLVSLLLVSGLTSPAYAQSITLYWDGNGSSSGSGGTGTWDTTTTNWSTDGYPPDTVWDNTEAADYAGFQSTAGTVTLGADITVRSLTFGSTGYTIAGLSVLALLLSARKRFRWLSVGNFGF